MKTVPAVLFLQKRSHRAGAQTSLARMLGSRPLSHIRPIALLGTTGWLAKALSEREVENMIIPFPSPRSLKSRMTGLGVFARKVTGELSLRKIQPAAVFANDHQECPLALSIAKELGNVPVVGLLRTPGMDQRDFRKYRCGDCDALLCEGKVLQERVRQWTEQETGLFEEGFSDGEFRPLRAFPQAFPDRILVIGSEDLRKGFIDFIEALDWIEAHHPEFPSLRCDFTGLTPEGSDALLARERRARFCFLGRIDDFADRVLDYPLAIHPSRAETFGMAPIEALIAGTPTLVSATGIVEELDLLEPWRFPPRDIVALAHKLVEIWKGWPGCTANLGDVQEHLRASFHIDHTAQSVEKALSLCGIK